MKTKIIYISGGETFEMQQIRAAFEEVRATLGLDNETVLFGVPVDCDTALAEDITVTDAVIPTPIAAPVIIEEASEISPEPEIVTPTIDTNIPQEPITETIAAEQPEPVADTADDDVVIPILSVLASKQSEEVAEQETVSEPAAPIAEVKEAEVAVISDINIDAELVTPATDETEPVEKITIGDMIDDAAPEKPVEKTLEQLLESMTPLREDMHTEKVAEGADNQWDTDNNFAETDTDATLAQLASEFAENEDKIVASPKAESHGKIGKLKNILPFKKAKRDDSSLMGDLFGWAGVAANDDDFSIPGFFTPARKQG